MARATWNGTVIAESDDTITVEGNVYFPPDSVKRRYVEESDATSRCIWKGKAQYYDLSVKGKRNPDAAWYYPKPWPLARRLKDHVAFWGGVKVTS